MLTKMMLGVAAVATTAAVSLSGGPSWHITKRVSGGSFAEFTAIVATGSNGGWAFDGQSGATAWERNGSTWTKMPFPSKSSEEITAAAASSASNVWAFTGNGFGGKSRALHWNGTSWSVAGSLPRAVGSAVVFSPTNVWAFGQPYQPIAQLGAWHYNGHSWSAVAGGQGLGGGSAVSTSSIWAYAGTNVVHWNGSSWTRTSVVHLLPAKNSNNFPQVTAVYAVAANNVYAIGSGNYGDGGGPTVVLHYNGSGWSRVGSGNYGTTAETGQAICSDGHGGLWLPVPGADGDLSYLLHYSGGHLTNVPFSPAKLDLLAISRIPGSTSVLAAGYAHPPNNPGINPTAVIAEYGS